MLTQLLSERLWIDIKLLAPEGKVTLALEKKMECSPPITEVRCLQILKRPAEDRHRQSPSVRFTVNPLSLQGNCFACHDASSNV